MHRYFTPRLHGFSPPGKALLALLALLVPPLLAGRGVGVVISPWNFPLAILCGMAGIFERISTLSSILMRWAAQNAAFTFPARSPTLRVP